MKHGSFVSMTEVIRAIDTSPSKVCQSSYWKHNQANGYVSNLVARFCLKVILYIYDAGALLCE